MSQFVLDLYANKSAKTGAFMEYAYNSNNPVSVNVNPSGRVWWQSPDSATTWTPLPATRNVPANQYKDGDPNFAFPLVKNGDALAVQLVDLNPSDPVNKVASVQFVVLFAKSRDPQNQNQHRANRASPIQADPSNNGAAQTMFVSPVITPNGGFARFDFGPASYPTGTNRAGFTFYVAAKVTFGDGTVVQYAHDPEMDVEDYGGGN